MDARTVSATLVVVLLFAPTAFAAWSVKGAWEPDTPYDVATPWMETGPTSSHQRLVYFNGFGALGGAVATTLNPNLATVAGSVHPLPFTPVVMMGVWKDCNQDGFVGLGDNGLLEYRADLLLNDEFCPPMTPPPGQQWRSHHHDGWVVELIPIGYDDTRTAEDENPYNINDTRARVWADWGLPGDPPRLACPTFPAPYGTFRSTGGLLRHADCFTGHQVVASVSAATAAAGQPGLGFGDVPAHRPDQSASPLNVPNPWGQASDDSMATVFDCSRQTEYAVQDPTDPGDGSGALHTLAVVPVPGADPLYLNATDRWGRVVNASVAEVDLELQPDGSLAGSVNETQAATDCDREDPDEIVDLNGKREGSDADLPYALEGNTEPISPLAPRARTDHVLSFEEGLRGTGLASLLLGPMSRDDAGAGTYTVTGFWVGIPTSSVSGNPFLSRTSLGAEPVTNVTYYGYISPSLERDAGITWRSLSSHGIYGLEGCDRPTATFECDSELWWRDAAGQDVTPRDARLGSAPGSSTTPAEDDSTRIGVRVGQPFYFRDIDCYDMSIGAARVGGVHWGRLSGTRCVRPAV